MFVSYEMNVLLCHASTVRISHRAIHYFLVHLHLHQEPMAPFCLLDDEAPKLALVKRFFKAIYVFPLRSICVDLSTSVS
jgi:hypothetical protein